MVSVDSERNQLSWNCSAWLWKMEIREERKKGGNGGRERWLAYLKSMIKAVVRMEGRMPMPLYFILSFVGTLLQALDAPCGRL